MTRNRPHVSSALVGPTRKAPRPGRHLTAGAVLLAMATLVAPSNDLRADKPISLHPENPHYFLWQDKPTVLVTSGEHYGAVLNLDFDYKQYLDELKRCGLNHTRTFAGTYRELPQSFGITDNPLAPKPGRYICPWARSEEPGYADGGNKFDLSRWDAKYFERLRDFMSYAKRCGVVVELNLFCPMYRDELWAACPMNHANNINGVGDCAREEVYTLKHRDLLDVQIAATRKIVQELRDFDNLYYEVCNEPYFGGVTIPWQHRIVDTIVATERSFAHQHLISMNIANGQKKVDAPHPNVSIFNFHYCVPPDTVAMNYGLNRVIGENETGFRGREDILYRTEGWDFMLAGGALYNNLDYSFTPKHPDGSFTEYRSPGGGSRALRHQLSILKSFLEGFDFVHMRPDTQFIKSTAPKMTAYTLSKRNEAYAAYVHVPFPKKPKDLKSVLRSGMTVTLELELAKGNYRVEWLDTKTGDIIEGRMWQHSGGSGRLKSPRFDNDIALKIVRH